MVLVLLALPLQLTRAAQGEPAAPAQTPPQDIPESEFGQWDFASELFDAQGKSLTVITVKNGKLEFSRPAGETRQAFLKSLYGRGVKEVRVTVLGRLVLTEQGRIGLTAVGENEVFQALMEKEDGFDLANGAGSEILDRDAKLLATVSSDGGQPSLSLAPGQSLEGSHQAGLRFFYYKMQMIQGKPRARRVKLVRDESGQFKLD